jgi:hypothetical protein
MQSAAGTTQATYPYRHRQPGEVPPVKAAVAREQPLGRTQRMRADQEIARDPGAAAAPRAMATPGLGALAAVALLSGPQGFALSGSVARVMIRTLTSRTMVQYRSPVASPFTPFTLLG